MKYVSVLNEGFAVTENEGSRRRVEGRSSCSLPNSGA
jgi:hypothetical protein